MQGNVQVNFGGHINFLILFRGIVQIPFLVASYVLYDLFYGDAPRTTYGSCGPCAGRGGRSGRDSFRHDDVL